MIRSHLPLVDPEDVRIDPAPPGGEQLRLFSGAADPYHFCVDGISVEVVYATGAPSLQHRLTDLCGRPQ